LASATRTTCRFDSKDVGFMLKVLPKLPGKESPRPLTLDLNGKIALRSPPVDQPQGTELSLSRSTYEGTPVRLNLNRDHLERALQMGFQQLEVVDTNRPLVFRENQRTFVAMPLISKDALEPNPDSLRLDSANMQQPTKTIKREKTMSVSENNGLSHEP